jgi:hypothetical protein
VLDTTMHNSNMTSFFLFVNKQAFYRLGIISLAHAPVHGTDFLVVNVHVDELLSARIWQHKLYAALSANVNINYCLSIKVYQTFWNSSDRRTERAENHKDLTKSFACVFCFALEIANATGIPERSRSTRN